MNKPKLYIPRTVYQQIMHWVNQEDLEVSGMGKVHYVADGNYFYVSKVYLLEQEVGSAHTDIDAVALGKLEYQTMKQDGDLNFWWHSHVKMGVFWSGTDTNTIKTMGGNGYCVATVFNQLNAMRTAVCYKAKTDFGETLHFMDECETIVYDPEPSAETKAQWTAQYKELVKRKVYTPAPTDYSTALTATPTNGVGQYSFSYEDWEVRKVNAAIRRADKLAAKIMNSIDVMPAASKVVDLLGKYKNLKPPIRFEAAVLCVNPHEYYQLCEHFDQATLTAIDNKLLTYCATEEYEKVIKETNFEY